MSRLSYLGKQFAVCAIDDFVNVKVSNMRHRVVKLFVILCLTALALHLVLSGF